MTIGTRGSRLKVNIYLRAKKERPLPADSGHPQTLTLIISSTASSHTPPPDGAGTQVSAAPFIELSYLKSCIQCFPCYIHSTISFFEVDDAVRSTDLRFSVEVKSDAAPADLSLDTERAAVFHITVTGMKFRLDNGHKSVDTMTRLDLRRSRERLMSAGRMVCLLKQQLNI